MADPDVLHDLGARVIGAARRAGAAPGPHLEAAVEDLLHRWGAPARGYHDRTHLAEVLDAVAWLAPRCDLADPDLALVELAAAWHDAEYDGRPGRDEAVSAALAGDSLGDAGVAPDAVARVQALVLVTADHRPPFGDMGAAVLCDADLAVLAAPPARYAAYVAGVRLEYAHVPDDAFRAGRAAVLRSLLDGPLFTTAAARQRWEAAARAQVEAEITSLLS